MDWHEGYVSDIEYVAEFFPEQSPTLLSFACILNGVEPVALDRPFCYCELGAGQGLTANVLAAAHPHGRFYAADFNPAHVAASRQLAEAAELDNIIFLEHSFAALADGAAELPQFDFVTLHGVYSWINADNRRHVVRFLERYLKPGGIAYVSYNAMPGWSSVLPLQRLILEHAGHAGSRHQQIARMRELLGGLLQNGAAYFSSNANASLGRYLDTAMEGDADRSRYLAHEYMNQGWEPLYHADVARDLAAAKLDYAASAGLSWAMPALYLTPEQSALLDDVADPALRETLKDYMKNTCFRKDIFVRGARRMSEARQQQWLEKTGVALTCLRENVRLELNFPVNRTMLAPSVIQPLLDALAQGPRTLLELSRLPALADQTLAEIAALVALLADTGQAAVYFLSAAGADAAPSQRLNLAIAQQVQGGLPYRVFASALLGNGVKAPLFQRLVYRCLLQQSAAPLSSTEIAAQVWQQVRQQQQPVLLGERELDSEDEMINEIGATVQAILERRSPLWEQLRMLPAATPFN